MMAWVLVAALIVVCLLNGIFLDQSHRRLARASGRWVDALVGQQERHAAQIDKLLMWRHDPHTASLPEKTDTVLYLAPDDDDAWNEAHGRGD